MIKKLSGQYNEKNTAIHKLDSRLKIISILAFSLILILTNNPVKLTIASIFIVLLIILSQIRIMSIVQSIRTFLFVYVFIIIMYYLFSRERLGYGFMSLWKFTLLILTSLMLTETTTLSDIIKGIEWILNPLRLIKLNPRNTALMLSVTIRFIPSFFLYSQKVKEAQLSRLSTLKKPMHIKIFLIKLLNRMLNSAAALSDAIESRCYDIKTKNYISYKMLRFNKNDFIAAIIFVSLAAGILLSK